MCRTYWCFCCCSSCEAHNILLFEKCSVNIEKRNRDRLCGILIRFLMCMCFFQVGLRWPWPTSQVSQGQFQNYDNYVCTYRWCWHCCSSQTDRVTALHDGRVSAWMESVAFSCIQLILFLELVLLLLLFKIILFLNTFRKQGWKKKAPKKPPSRKQQQQQQHVLVVRGK